MTDKKTTRLAKFAREYNVGITTIVDFLHKKGIEIESDPNAKISAEAYELLMAEYSADYTIKKESARLHEKQKKEIKANTGHLEEKEETVDEVVIKDGTVSKTVESSFVPAEKKSKIAKPAKKELTPAKEEPTEIEKKAEVKVKVVGSVDLASLNQKTRPEKKSTEKPKLTTKIPPVKPIEPDPEVIPEVEQPIVEDNYLELKVERLLPPKILDKITLVDDDHRKKPSLEPDESRKGKRKRIVKGKTRVDVSRKAWDENVSGMFDGKGLFSKKKKGLKPGHAEISKEAVDKQMRDTLSKLGAKGKTKASKYRKEKREAVNLRQQEEIERQEIEGKILKLTEFISVNELASLMDVQVTDIISTCMDMGLFVSINQRLDAETIKIVADEFGFGVEFTTVEVQEAIKQEEDTPDQLKPRPPVVTVMGHVDHGKTKLLDYIRNTNVVAGEAGGITQHIGAYSVQLANGKHITFLDTPGHEAFTAMRARGARITDLVIIVVAADDGVKPQTVEAINHASAAGVPIVFAINKVDKPDANPEKVKEELAKMNFLVEAWGGKYQSQDISAKSGLNVDLLLEKVLLEAELLDLKANPDKPAIGTVVESSLDKGRGYVATVLVQAGTLKVGDILLAGSHTGRVKAMYNERNQRVDVVGPATPVLILGLDGAPQAGDSLNVLGSEKDAREIANKRMQLQREQGLRARKHITLDEIGRRIAIGNFKELNVIVKGDVDGSVEALGDSLIKLSTKEIVVNIIHKAVGQISESDILLAAASNAIVIGFQVRPSLAAKKLAEREEIDIRLYSIIYDAINELKSAMEGMLSPEIREEINANIEVREVFKITKVGTVAGCVVREGKITRDSKVRLIRDGIVIFTGKLGSLKRFKDDVREVTSGLECGLNIDNFNDIKPGDIIEGFKEIEIKKTL